MRRQPTHLFARKIDAAAVVREIAREQVEERGLAGAVGTDDRAHIARRNRQIHTVHGQDAAEVLPEADRLED